ncbi:hypothetical protein [Pelagibius sp.]|uniref:hypothetical protein n=1 Tax=Pelagibius sp. TaxID=1931238 RepID=UPI003B506BFC
MSKTPSLVLAALLAASALTPSLASAIDKGPCDHCTMEPIVVKGERPAKEEDKSQEPNQEIRVEQPDLKNGYSPQFYFQTRSNTSK